MVRASAIAIALLLALSPATALAASAYCEGFAAGWKAAFETRGKLVQLTPLCPLPPLGRDNYQSGYEAGLLRALSQMSR